MKERLKSDPVVQKIFEDQDMDFDLFDGIPVDFSDEIDVSAKTINSRIILNKKLLKEPQEIMDRYFVHELTHSLQHMKTEGHRDPYEAHDYLDRPDEVEAFKYQIEFDKNNRGENEVVEYVEELIDYHDIPEHKKEDKKKELLDE